MMFENQAIQSRMRAVSSAGAAVGDEGFTLLELLVVLVILGLLAAIAVPQVMNYLGGARTSAAKLQIKALSESLDLYRLDVSHYPTAQEGLAALVTQPADLQAWHGPYIKDRASLVDPWGRPYHYAMPGQHGAYDLYTLGADNAEGGSGEDQDVGNW